MSPLTAGSISIVHVMASLALTLALTIAIIYVYRITHRSFSYSQNFVSTLIIMSMITTVAMLVIGDNLATAFGLLGAFTLIRFRTVVKETRDTGFIFFALLVGMAVGTGTYMIAVTSTAIILVVIFLLHKFNFGSIYHNDYLLTFTIDHEKNPPDSFLHIFERYLKNSMLVTMSAKGAHQTEMVYSVRLVSELQGGSLIKELSEASGVEQVHLVSAKADVEY